MIFSCAVSTGARYPRVRGIQQKYGFMTPKINFLTHNFPFKVSFIKHFSSFGSCKLILQSLSIKYHNFSTYLNQFLAKTDPLLMGARYPRVRGIQRKRIFSCAVSTGARYRRDARCHREITVISLV